MARVPASPADPATLLHHLAALFNLTVDSPDFGDRLLDRIGNLQHQNRHQQLFEHCLRRNRVLTQENRTLQLALERMAAPTDSTGSPHPLYLIFNRCIERSLQETRAQATETDFWHHRDLELAVHYGPGYLYAQAMHDLRQAQAMPRQKGQARRLEAINHIAMGLLHEERRGK